MYEALNALGESGTKFRIKVSYTLVKNKKLLVPYIENIEECRRQLYIQFGEPQEDGTLQIPNNKLEAFAEEYNSLMNTENDIPFGKVRLEDFSDETIDIKIIEALMPMFEEEIEPNVTPTDFLSDISI